MVLFVVFSSIREIPKENFGIYLITGVLFFQLFSKGTMTGVTSLKGNSPILKSFNLDKELFPIIATGTTCLLLAVYLGVLFGLMPIAEFSPTWTIIFLPIVLVLFLILILGMNYILSILFVFIRDVQPLWGILVHALLFISPIFWYTSEVDGILLEIQKINPFGQILELAHQVIIFGTVPTIQEWTYTSIPILIILFGGFAIFKKYEEKIVEKL